MAKALILYKIYLEKYIDLDDPKHRELYRKSLHEYNLLIMQSVNPSAFKNNIYHGFKIRNQWWI